MKTPNVGALKNVTNTAVTAKTSQVDAKKAANEEAFKKQSDTTIAASNKKLDDSKILGKASVWDLAKIILDEETYKSFDENPASKAKYLNAVKNLQISLNRCENIMNNMSPT